MSEPKPLGQNGEQGTAARDEQLDVSLSQDGNNVPATGTAANVIIYIIKIVFSSSFKTIKGCSRNMKRTSK